DEFLANMSHELRTPLNAILGMTEGLLEEIFGSLTERQKRTLQTINRSGAHLLELINDILDVAKIESGQTKLECVPMVIAPLCQDSLAFVTQQALKKNIQLEIQLSPQLPVISVDERRIRQVLINLLNNAVKFTPEGGHITLEASATGNGFVRIAVTDTGIGIAPHHIKQLFRPFIQVNTALNRQYEGTGLGLALVKRIVELHGGQVGLTSEVGVGSCFTIDLPCEALTPDFSGLEPLGEGSNASFSHWQKAPLVLLAEDNEANINMISSYLIAKGCRVQVARDGQQAIDLAQAELPDIILMDIQMPGIDGLEAMQQIRRNPALQSTPIIAITALAMIGDCERCLAAGASHYLSKPLSLRELLLIIQESLTPQVQ
ncbi:MAG: ATP-binding protein, partial [Leptolyngbyaceae cyanobacterium bins.59]|nr:ATP-binding protein [Leptolyngbyaceae cyanobacterium bins.59]